MCHKERKGSDEECDDDNDDDDEVDDVDEGWPGKAEAGAPVTLWGFGAASETTIRLRKKKNAPRNCSFVPIMSTLFVYLSTCHVSLISVLFKQAHFVSMLS